ncbi:hypothetical protein BH09PSE5_BH09PSE5_28830 [soil metagenome]
MPDSPLDPLRRRVVQVDDEVASSQAQLAQARIKLDRARATGVGDAAEAQAEVDRAASLAQARRDALLAARNELRDRLATQGGGIVPAATIAPADVPVALLPVGLETRFRGDTLLIRVIPDEIHVEDHEKALAEAEVTAGRAFWRDVWRAGTAEPAATEAERLAWGRLAAASGSSQRAGWVAKATAPIGRERPVDPVPADVELPEPPFGDVLLRPAEGVRTPSARTLPDNFIAIAYRRNGSGGSATYTEIARAVGKPVDDAVQLGLDPTDPTPTVDDDGPALPAGMRWMLDPQAAEDAGLLLRIALPVGTNRIDRLVVLGVLGSLNAADSSSRLAELMDSHHYTRGLAVIPVGTPTNNTRAERSGFARDAADKESFSFERRTPAPVDGTDGGLLCRAFGIPASALDGVAHSNDREQIAAGQMNALVWPAAMGYWLDSLVQPGPTDAVIEDIRQHAMQWVRGRGPLPPLRIGRQPYGVLPVTSLKTWTASSEPNGVRQTVTYMLRAYSWWLDGVQRAPVVRAGADPDKGMLDVMGQAPVSSTVGVRSMVGANACYIPNGLTTASDSAKTLAGEANRQRWMALLGMKSLGVTGFPYIGQLVGRADPIPTLRMPYAVDTRLPPDQQTVAWQAVSEYLRGLRNRPTAELKAEDPRNQQSLLGLLARRSVLLGRLRVGVKDTHGQIGGHLVEAQVRVDATAVLAQSIIPTTATLRVGDTLSATARLMNGSVAEADGSMVAMERYLDTRLVGSFLDPVRYTGYSDVLNAAEAVAALPSDRAALLLGEALDVASHRFDAWVTSLATRRLEELRATTPTGITLGAYGVVEDLVRQPLRVPIVTPPEGAPSPLLPDVAGGGYIHAPSLQHAATAAVLRAGQLAHAARDPNSAALAVDLSSSRVRLALELLDGVRQGQSLGALLGYRAERRLHDAGAHTAVEVIRALAPPPVVTAEGTPEGLPPRAVCDGLALSRMDRAVVLREASKPGVDTDAVQGMLDALADQVDAVADLLLAESVHQIVQGNPDRAAAALDTLNRGDGAVSDPAVVRTPRSGTTLTHRVLIALGADTPAAPSWPVDGVRAKVEPRVAAWAGVLLGDSGDAAFTVTSGNVVSTVSVRDLGIGALDVVHEDLAARVLRHARGLGVPEGAAVNMDSPSVARLLATAEMLRGLLTKARVGSGLDLVRPQDRGSVVDGPLPDAASAGADSFQTVLPDVDRGDKRARLDGARATLQIAIDGLPVLPLDAAAPAEASLAASLNVLASFGIVPGGDPSLPPDAMATTAVRNAALATLTRSLTSPDDPAALFGEGFAVLPLASPRYPAITAAALARDPIAATSDAKLAGLGGKAHALESWLETHGRVRPAVGRLADVLLAARLRPASSALPLRAMQLPAEPFPDAPEAERGSWVGVTFPSALGPEPVASLVMQTLGTIDLTAGVGVLVIDEFSEVLPSSEATTAMAFGFDAPGARPPQSLLLAVPSQKGVAWTVDSLAALIGETVDLAKIRMVDLSAVAWAGRFLPTVHLTDGDLASGLDTPMRDVVIHADQRFMEFDQ